MEAKKIIGLVLRFVKSEAVLCAAWTLALVSMFFVHPDREYFSYIDWRSLGILWSLMVIMNVFRQNGFFDLLAQKLLSSVKKIWMLIGTLVFLCFFLSMAITNDVALLTFVPFAITILEGSELLVPTIVLQTIAANLGSMLMPIGNPQNLYLFAAGNFSASSFIKLTLPYWILSLVLLVPSIFFVTRKSSGKLPESKISTKNKKSSESKTFRIVSSCVFTLLFVLAILTVIRIIPFYILVALVLIFSLILQRHAFLGADYLLLLTFVGFFIFTGNMARIPAINGALKKLVEGRELLLGIASSQIISNVPAALLLSGFAKNISLLIVGVNIGGLGTLIASMASLISFKFYSRTKNSRPAKYILYFTIANLIFLAALIVEHFLI